MVYVSLLTSRLMPPSAQVFTLSWEGAISAEALTCPFLMSLHPSPLYPGLYPNGGGCTMCGSVEHFRRDCPEADRMRGIDNIALDTLDGGVGGGGASKSADATEDVPLATMPTYGKDKKKKFGGGGGGFGGRASGGYFGGGGGKEGGGKGGGGGKNKKNKVVHF